LSKERVRERFSSSCLPPRSKRTSVLRTSPAAHDARGDLSSDKERFFKAGRAKN